MANILTFKLIWYEISNLLSDIDFISITNNQTTQRRFTKGENKDDIENLSILQQFLMCNVIRAAKTPAQTVRGREAGKDKVNNWHINLHY